MKILASRTYVEMGFRSNRGIVVGRGYADIALTRIGFVLLEYN